MLGGFSIDLLLAIAGIAISIGGFAQVFFLENTGKRKTILLATSLVFLCVLFGIAIFDQSQQQRLVRETSRSITEALRGKTYLTIDQLYAEIYPPVDYSIVTEAMDQLTRDGITVHKTEDFNLRDGSVIQVRVFSLK